MKIEIIHCDICGYKFAAQEHWEQVPASVEFNLQSPPRQAYESCRFEHVCWFCIEALKTAFHKAVEARKTVKA